MTNVVTFGSFLLNMFGLLMLLTATFLILLVLIQRGRGGGLSGAFGGMGGQSAFGSKAGDTFTYITIVVATFWILLCVAGVAIMKKAGHSTIFDEEEDVVEEVAPGSEDMSTSPATDPDAKAATDESAASESATDANNAKAPQSEDRSATESPAEVPAEIDEHPSRE